MAEKNYLSSSVETEKKDKTIAKTVGYLLLSIGLAVISVLAINL